MKTNKKKEIFKKNKKGFMYLIVSSLLVLIFLIMFFTTNTYKFQDKEELYLTRIRTTNDFTKNFNDDIHRATHISAFRTLIALEDEVTSTGNFLTDINSSFKETFFFGTINGVEKEIMQNASFEDYIARVKLLANSMGITLDVNITKIDISQSSPWDIDVHVFATINVSDNRKVASWVYNKEYLTTLPIYNLRDPMYGKYTFNKIPNAIKILNSTELVSGTNITNLITHINGSYYIASNLSPNFISRFEGKTSADPNGIESIINIQVLSDQDLIINRYAVKVDYIYFNNIATDKVCDVQNIPSDFYFVIPSNRISLYQISGLNYSINCT